MTFLFGCFVGAFVLWAWCMARSAKLGDQGMREMVRSDSLDVQRELAPECAA